MSFFRNFPVLDYKFGSEIDTALFQNLTSYIDIIDQVVDETSFYEKYVILDGERPDTLSYKLYGTVDYYWTFYFLNEALRLQGWPLESNVVYSKAKEYYPNTTLVTDESVHGEFYKNDIVATKPFNNPPFKGKILEKRLDLGQVIVKPLLEIREVTVSESGSGYTSTPTITLSGGGGTGASLQAILDSDTVTSIAIVNGGDGYTSSPTITISAPNVPRGTQATATATLSSNLVSSGSVVYSQANQPDTTLWDDDTVRALTTTSVVNQYNSVHHYNDSNGKYTDATISTTAGKALNFSAAGLQGLTPITHTDRLIEQNDNLKRINIFKPGVVEQVSAEFQRLLKQ